MRQPRSDIHFKKETFKMLLSHLNQEKYFHVIKTRLMKILRDTSPLELAYITGELARDRLPSQGFLALYSAHLDIFKESLKQGNHLPAA